MAATGRHQRVAEFYGYFADMTFKGGVYPALGICLKSFSGMEDGQQT